MIDALAPYALQGGATALVAATVWAVLTGRLVSRRVLEDVRTDRDARVAEARAEVDNWRAAYLAEVERARVLLAAVDELLELGRPTAVRPSPGAGKDQT
jgi:hypothetical protein